MNPINRALGIVGIAVIVVAAAFAAYLLTQDDGGENAVADDTKSNLKYDLEFREYVDGWGFTMSFRSDVNGSVAIYLNDSPLCNALGEPIFERFLGGEVVRLSYGLDYPEGMDYEDVVNGFEPRFSSNIVAVQA